MRLLEDNNLLAKTRTALDGLVSISRANHPRGYCFSEDYDVRARLLVLERLEFDSLDVHCKESSEKIYQNGRKIG